MAATSIVRLSLESNQYEQKLRGAKRQFEDFTASIGINMKQLTMAGIAIGAATTAINAFTSACSEAITRGVELANQAEGVRRAFERLDKPGLLNNLREATHGTVSDLELMKNAVKFDNFNLSLDQMGTFLAFAQQQAKDTGQSVEYLVDSIVTGLGRKSLPILDNLGLSATDIRTKMKEVGDMTTAVSEIIKERMAQSGEYVETTADRIAQANASLENKMEELGRQVAPLKQAYDDLWTSFKLKVMEIVSGPLTDLLNGLTRAGEIRNEIARQGGTESVTRDIEKLRGSNFKPQAYSMMLAGYFRRENAARDALIEAQKGGKGGIGIYETRYAAAQSLRQEFQRRGQDIVNPATPKPAAEPIVPTTIKPTKVEVVNEDDIRFGGWDGVKADPDMYFQSPFEMFDKKELRKYLGTMDEGEPQRNLSFSTTKGRFAEDQRTDKEQLADINSIANGVGNIFSGLENLGVEIPKELQSVVSGIQIVTGILSTISALITIIAAIQGTKAIPVVGWLLANGGVLHAENGNVPGNRYSGDNIPALLNSGETVLTRAQSSALVSQLNNGGLSNLQLEAIVTGEDLRFVLNNNGRHTGVGVLVTSNMRRNG